MPENQYTITKWADETFGKTRSPLRAAIRANEEMAELLKHLSQDEIGPEGTEYYISKIRDEIADIHIVLARVATISGIDIQRAIDDKMQINRARTWKRDGTGHGYHVKDNA